MSRIVKQDYSFIVILYFLLCFSFLSCERGHWNSNIIDEDVAIPLAIAHKNSLANMSNNLKYLYDSGEYYIYTFSWKDKAIYIGDTDSISKKIDLDILSNKVNFSYGTDVVLKSREEAILLSTDDGLLLFINLLDLEYEIIKYRDLIPANMEPISYWSYPMVASDKIHFSCTYNDLYLNDEKSFIDYFSRQTEVSFYYNLSKVEARGSFPNSYKGGVYFDDLYVRMTKIEGGGIIHSYSCEDTVYIQGLKGQQPFYFGSKNRPTFSEFPLNELQNMFYSRRYMKEEPKYLQIVYDPFTKLVYRVFKNRSKYLTDDGKVIANDQIPWSLLVSDMDFDHIEEFEFIKGVYSPIGIIPTPNGLFIQKYKTDNENEIKGSYFKITEY